MLRCAILVSKNPASAFSDQLVRWIVAQAGSEEFELSIHYLDSARTPVATSASVDKRSTYWKRRLAGFDAFIIVTDDHCRDISDLLQASIKSPNANFRHHPVGFVGYGVGWGTKAIDALSLLSVKLGMAPLGTTVIIPHGIVLEIARGERELRDVKELAKAMQALVAELQWWAQSLKIARGRGTGRDMPDRYSSDASRSHTHISG